MKRSPFAIVSLLAGIAFLFAVTAFLAFSMLDIDFESDHPLTMLALPLIAMLVYVDAPFVKALGLPLELPVVAPLIGIVTGVASLLTKETMKRTALAGIGLAILASGILLVMSLL